MIDKKVIEGYAPHSKYLIDEICHFKKEKLDEYWMEISDKRKEFLMYEAILEKSKKKVEENQYNLGFSAKQKETDKILTDTLNKYRSKLVEEQTPKLDKTLNKDKIKALEAKIWCIKEIQSKLF